MNPVLSYGIGIPKSKFSSKARRNLTVKVYDAISEETTKVSVFRERGNLVYIPRQYGLDYLPVDVEYEDQLSTGVPVDYPKKIKLYDEQKPFVDGLMRIAETDYDAVAKAATGKGKTVMSLEVIRRRGVTALVVVDQELLRDQWISAAKEFLGLRDNDIGIVQGSKCIYRGKKIVIAMLQSLYNKEYDKGLYRYFGTVVFDEVHTVGAEKFSNVLFQFSADFRFGVSATPDRNDALSKVIRMHLGPVKVALKAIHKKSQVRYVNYDGVLSWYANVSPKSGRYISEIVSDPIRNEILADIIYRMYTKGRDILAVSDRLEHLDVLAALCYYKGIPQEDIGIVAGYDMRWAYAKDATPRSKPHYLHKGSEYTPVSIQRVKKRIPKKELTKRKEEKRIILATYGMFTKGVDVPRLSVGIDCTPRAKAVQVHGRILRPSEGKATPIWITIRDHESYKAEYQFSKRLSEYIESNAEIYQWDLSKGIRKVNYVTLMREVKANIKRLKSAKILTRRDGSNIVLTATTGKR